MLGGIALERRDTSECLQGCHTQFCHPGGHRKSPKPPPTGPRGQTRQRFFGNLQEAGTRHPPPRTVLVMGTTRQRRLREISMAMAHLQNENAGTGPPHPPHHPHLSHGQYGRHQPHSLHHSRPITTAPGQPPTQPPAPPPTPQPTELDPSFGGLSCALWGPWQIAGLCPADASSKADGHPRGLGTAHGPWAGVADGCAFGWVRGGGPCRPTAKQRGPCGADGGRSLDPGSSQALSQAPHVPPARG